MKPIVLWQILLGLALAACGAPGAEQPSATSEPVAEPSDTPAPLPTAAPTFTPLPPTEVPTATPVGQIFRDDFGGPLGPGWEWQNEDAQRWEITDDGWLQIAGGDTALLAEGTQSNVLWRQLPEGDFQITVRVRTDPAANFQQTTIYIYENAQNYIALNRGYCAPCTPGGNAIYMEYKIGGGFGAYHYATTATDLYLRLASVGTELSGWYSLNGTDWNRVGRFGNFYKFSRVGLGVTNVDRQGSINADLIGQFDFFEIMRP